MQCNNRDWFQEHKKDYEQAVKNPGTAIGEEFAQALSGLAGSQLSHKLFRINRDIRFSKDKTPYNAHMHLSWGDGSGPGFFFGVSPEYVTAGCGIMGLQKERLDAYRRAVDKDGDKIAPEVSARLAEGYRMYEPELKRVPAPYDKDHPHEELLRRKSLALWLDFEENDVSKDRLMATYEALLPVYRFLQGIG